MARPDLRRSDHGGSFAHVFQDSDRQPRRNRCPHHQDGPPSRSEDGGGLFRSGCGQPGRRDGRRERVDRPAGSVGKLPRRGQDHRGRQGDRGGSHPPRLRLPVGKGLLCPPVCGSRDRVHRPEPPRHRRHGRQDRIQEVRQCGQRLHRAGLYRRDRRRAPRHHDRRGDRLSGDDEGVSRRRRQGHAHCLEPQGRGRGLPRRPVRGPQQLRRRPGVHREVRDRAPAHRDPGAGRQARHRDLSQRAGMLDPAAEPEGDRGSAVAVP